MTPPPESPPHEQSPDRVPGAEGARLPAEGEPAASLEGPMGALDGKQLPNTERPTRVPVGCHVLTTNTSSLVHDGINRVRITGPPVWFAIDFRNGHRYVIERTILSSDSQGNRGTVALRTQVHERDRQGALVKVHQPVPPELAGSICANSGA